MNDLIDKALQLRVDIAAGNTLPTEDDAFIVYRDSARNFELFDPSVQKPSSPHPIIIDPRDGAAAGFGIVVVTLNLFVPPAAGKNVGAGELIDIAVFVSEDEPTILMGMTRPAGQRDGLRHNPAHQ